MKYGLHDAFTNEVSARQLAEHLRSKGHKVLLKRIRGKYKYAVYKEFPQVKLEKKFVKAFKRRIA